MNNNDENHGAIWALAGSLAGRYGQLALARAAGQAAAAERKGDRDGSAIWYGVIAHLRGALH